MISRRIFLKGALAGIWGLHLGNLRNVWAVTGIEGAKERVLRLYNTHTGEHLHTRYWARGDYIHEEVSRIHHFLRCHYANTVKPINMKVVDLLCDVKNFFAWSKEINIISGYRSPEYNEHLRSIGRHVSGNSLHLDGLAIDFAIPGTRTDRIAQAAAQFQAGGVGLYQDFVHIDVGRVRRW
jgi:uncharacterized protein YcbK (DUF882 family)